MASTCPGHVSELRAFRVNACETVFRDTTGTGHVRRRMDMHNPTPSRSLGVSKRLKSSFRRTSPPFDLWRNAEPPRLSSALLCRSVPRVVICHAPSLLFLQWSRLRVLHLACPTSAFCPRAPCSAIPPTQCCAAAAVTRHAHAPSCRHAPPFRVAGRSHSAYGLRHARLSSARRSSPRAGRREPPPPPPVAAAGCRGGSPRDSRRNGHPCSKSALLIAC